MRECLNVIVTLAVAAVTVQGSEAQEKPDPPRNRTVLEVADRTFPPACAGRGCGRQRFAITIMTTETDSARIAGAMRDAVFYDAPDHADAVIVFLRDKWPDDGMALAAGEYSADGCGWGGSRDGSDCGGPKWKIYLWMVGTVEAVVEQRWGSARHTGMSDRLIGRCGLAAQTLVQAGPSGPR